VRTLRRLLLVLCVTTSAHAADLEAAYTAWGQGRPAEAVPSLHAAAAAEDHWALWCDLGLAAAAAGDRGRAAAWLLTAHRRAPGAEEPVAALAVLGAELEPTWSGRLGPLAVPGQSLAGPLLFFLAAGCLALAAIRPRRGLWPAGLICLALALPGQIALHLDATRDYVAVVQPSHLLDSTGEPIEGADLPPGTVLRRADKAPWGGRILVELDDGRRGWLPLSDTRAEPVVPVAD